MFVVIEGPDGSGKSTLIENLRGDQTKAYFVILRASRYPPDGRGYPYVYAARELARDFIYPVICDRFHPISESVYAPVLRGGDEWNLRTILFDLETVDLIVYCRPPAKTIHEGVKQNKQLAGVVEKTDDLIDRYDRLMDHLMREGHKVLTYDWTVDPPDKVANAIFRKRT
jgi:thymidylate kinase